MKNFFTNLSNSGILMVACTFLLSITALAPTSTQAQVLTNYVCDTLAPALKHPLDTIVVSFPSQIVLAEGQPSMAYSSVRSESDYFVLPTVHTNGGRILRMTPFTTSDSRPWYGIEETNAIFIDHLSGELFIAPLTEAVGPSGEKIHHGSMVVDGMDVCLKVFYAITPRYPSVIMTWGVASDYSDVGSALDVMSCPPEPEIVPTNSVKSIDDLRRLKGAKIKYAQVLTLERPLHAKHRIEASAKGKTWQPIDRNGLLLNKTLDQVVVRGNTRWKMFRIVTAAGPVSN